jgi:DNA transformation protein
VPVTDGFRDFVIEQLEQVARDIRARRMFGAVGIYCGDLFFAVIADDRVYFKVDDQTRPKFDAEGMQPFRPYGEDYAAISYYEVPVGVLESPDDLRVWARTAVGAAQRAGMKPRRKRR